ncbi:MAG: polymerase, sigma-24 subunit, subfamily [Acidimicrobiales bacterium]|nr:polymerase, sigma-24 subunit, subfamily [Acidimicrobiales bacterium]
MTVGTGFDEVLEAARTGAPWAVTVLYRDVQPALLGYLRSQEPSEAEDLASEVWHGVALGLARFEGGEAAFRGWLFTIARRRLVDLRRRRTRRPADPTRDEALIALAGSDDPEAEAISTLTAEETHRKITAVLPPEQAEVVLLRVIGGLDAAQVAAVLGKRPGTVRVLQHRALRHLAKVFSPKDVTA